MAESLLLVDDDQRLMSMVTDYLAGLGFLVTVVGSLELARSRLQVQRWDAVVLDIMLPDGLGLDLLRGMRAGVWPANRHTPVVMLTARGDAMDRVVGLEMGADDYLPKPFEMRELVARLRAVLRRSPAAWMSLQGARSTGSDWAQWSDATLRQATLSAGARALDAEVTQVLCFGRLEIDSGARQVRLDGLARPMTAYQFSLLLALAERAGRVLTRDQIMDALKGETHDAYDRSIDVHVSKLRQALEDDPKSPKRILTVRGVGYVFAKVQDGVPASV